MIKNVRTLKFFGVIFVCVVLISSINRIEDILNTIGFYLVALWMSWQFTKLYINYYCIEKVNTDRKAVLITGCDTGFGHILAQQLDSIGFTVFAACLDSNSKGAQNLINKCSKRLEVLKLDVTQDEDVVEALSYVKNNLGENQFWGLVNNAGILHFLPLEWGQPDIEIFRSQMDVNAFGVVRVTKAFLPLLRKTKDSRIVNVGSLAGRLSLPGVGSYAMSKFAVRAFSDALRNEVKHFDINVSLIEPTVYSTDLTDMYKWTDDFMTKWKESPEDIRNDYGPKGCDALYERINAMLSTAIGKPQEVVDTMIDALININPKSNYPVSKFSDKIINPLVECIPTEFSDILLMDPIFLQICNFYKNKNHL